MSQVLNDRDVLLDAAPVRNVNPTLGKQLLLTVDPQFFHVRADGTSSPALVTLTAHLLNIPGSVTWSLVGGSLAGSTSNVRTVALASMTGDSAVATAQITYQGQAYLATRTISIVRDTAAADLSPEALKSALEGQITESELFAALRSKISLITDPANVVGSVTARVKAEADGRIAAISKEVDDRTAAIIAEGIAQQNYVVSYTYSKLEATAQIGLKADAITTAYTSYADAKKLEAVSIASADVRSYTYARSTIDLAEIAQTNNLTTAFTNYADAKKAEAITVASADVRNYTYIKSAIDGAEIAQTNSLTTAFQTYADAKKLEAISIASADVRSYAYSVANVNGALAQQFNTLTANYQQYGNDSRDGAIIAASADVRSYTFAKADITGAISTATSTLTSTVGEHTTAIQTTAQTVNGLGAQLTWKIDNNGYGTGFGLASTAIDGAPISSFIINADRFAVVSPGKAPKVMFSVGTIFGVSALGMDGSVMLDGTLSIRNAQGSIVLSGGDGVFSGGLSAAYGSFGVVTIVPGGSISSGQTAFNTGIGWHLSNIGGVAKFSVGNSAGAHFKFDGTDISLTNVPLVNPVLSFPGFYLTGLSSSGSFLTINNGYQQVGSFQGVTPHGGTAPFVFNWNGTESTRNSINLLCSLGYDSYPNDRISTRASSNSSGQTAVFPIDCIVTDAAGRTATLSFNMTVYT